MAFSKIHPLALGVSVGVLSGISAFFVGVMALLFYTGKPLVGMMGSMYITYNPSLTNCVLGAVVVSINAFIGGYITSWVYNFLLGRI